MAEQEERFRLYFEWIINNKELNPDPKSTTITKEILERLNKTLDVNDVDYDDAIEYASTHSYNGVTKADFVRTMNISKARYGPTIPDSRNLDGNQATKIWNKIYMETQGPYDFLKAPVYPSGGRSKKRKSRKNKNKKRKSKTQRKKK